jgi:hypothetical protein
VTLDNGDLQFLGLAIMQGLTIGGLVWAWVKGAFAGGKTWERVTAAIDDHEDRITVIEGDYMTVPVHVKEQATCQRQLTDAFLLAMEKRDHALELKLIELSRSTDAKLVELGKSTDQKFTQICRGISDLQHKLERVSP